MSWTRTLLYGVAEHLQAQGVGRWLPDDDAVYAPDDVAIVLKLLPAEPTRAIALTTYQVRADARLSDVTIGLQARCRGTTDPSDVDDLDDAVYAALHGLRGVRLGEGVHLVQARWNSGAAMGADESDRWESTANYYLQLQRHLDRWDNDD